MRTKILVLDLLPVSWWSENYTNEETKNSSPNKRLLICHKPSIWTTHPWNVSTIDNFKKGNNQNFSQIRNDFFEKKTIAYQIGLSSQYPLKNTAGNYHCSLTFFISKTSIFLYLLLQGFL